MKNNHIIEEVCASHHMHNLYFYVFCNKLIYPGQSKMSIISLNFIWSIFPCLTWTHIQNVMWKLYSGFNKLFMKQVSTSTKSRLWVFEGVFPCIGLSIRATKNLIWDSLLSNDQTLEMHTKSMSWTTLQNNSYKNLFHKTMKLPLLLCCSATILPEDSSLGLEDHSAPLYQLDTHFFR